MKKHNFKFENGESGSALTLLVVPNSKRTEISSIMKDGTIKVKIKTPTTKGTRANQEISTLFSQILDIAPENVEIVAGESSTNKLISVLGIDPQITNERIMSNIKK
jgi:uncharacterized protein (TIGR00251 family)